MNCFFSVILRQDVSTLSNNELKESSQTHLVNVCTEGHILVKKRLLTVLVQVR